MLILLCRDGWDGWVDPDRSWLGRVLWSGVGEAFRVAGIGRIEHLLPLLDHHDSHAVVQHFRGQQGDPAVMMFVVVPAKERLAKGTKVLDGAEALRKLGPVLEGFGLALRAGQLQDSAG